MNRYIIYTQACTLVGGVCRSSVGAAHWGQAGDPSPGGTYDDYGRAVHQTRSYERANVVDGGACSAMALFDACYGFYCQADSPSGNDNSCADWHRNPIAQTRDTNGDGWTSGGGGPGFAGFGHPYAPGVTVDTSPSCTQNILIELWYYPGALNPGYPDIAPLSSYWRDETECDYASLEPGGPLAQVGPYSSSTTDVPGNGIALMQQNGGGLDGLFHNMAFEQKVELLNSVDSERDVRVVNDSGRQTEVMRLYVTKIRIGGRSYNPVNAYFELHDMRNITVDLRSPGWRLAQAWAAGQLEYLLNRHQGSMNFEHLRWSVTINDSFTINQQVMDKIGASTGRAFKVADPTTQWVSDLRRNAAFGRGDL